MFRTAALAILLALASAGARAQPALAPDVYVGMVDPYITLGDVKTFKARNYAALVQLANRIAAIKAHPDQRGCLGKPVFDCMATLAQSYPIGTQITNNKEYFSLNWPFDEQTDINGKPIQLASIEIRFLSPEMGQSALASLGVTGGTVTNVSMPLLSDPLSAKTFAEYEATRAYDMASVILGPVCAMPDRTTFYRLMNSASSPDKLEGRRFDESSSTQIAESTLLSATFFICGYKLEAQQYGHVSTESVTINNPHGVGVLHSLLIYPPSQH